MERLQKYGKSLKDFTYTNKEIADDIYSAINSTQFLGVSVSRSAAIITARDLINGSRCRVMWPSVLKVTE